MCEPIFSGDVRAEVNMIDRRKAQQPHHLMSPFEREIILEYKASMEKLENKTMLKGLWDSSTQIGSIPDSRESCCMVGIGKDIYMYGGYGRELFDDLRILNC